MMRRLALALAGISLMFVIISTICFTIALTMGGTMLLPMVIPAFMLNLVMASVDILGILRLHATWASRICSSGQIPLSIDSADRSTWATSMRPFSACIVDR